MNQLSQSKGILPMMSQLGGQIGAQMASTETPLMAAINNLDKNLRSLDEVLSVLCDRLKVVRNSMPTLEGSDKLPPRPQRSGMTSQIETMADRVQATRSEIQRLLNELDI